MGRRISSTDYLTIASFKQELNNVIAVSDLNKNEKDVVIAYLQKRIKDIENN